MIKGRAVKRGEVIIAQRHQAIYVDKDGSGSFMSVQKKMWPVLQGRIASVIVVDDILMFEIKLLLTFNGAIFPARYPP